jgi:serine/threonine protein kinase
MSDKYEAIEELGRGGFGVVEKVRDSRGGHFARKTFCPSPGIPREAHAGLKKRFRREVMTQSEHGGKAILPIIDYDLDGDSPWFVMPLAEKTYTEQIEEDRANGIINADALADILNGLESLHELDYTHRDLNPNNILLHDGRWKLSDLGAVLPPSGHTVTLTEQTVIYTENYCAPEQRKDFHRARPSADIYSFGCILHDIFVNGHRTPYQKHTAEGPIGIIIEKCTEQNPDRRPSISKLRELLLDTLIELGGKCAVRDEQASAWLVKLDSIDSWSDDDYENFARFFASLDLHARTDGHQSQWVHSLSTPFLTRVTSDALLTIATRDDGVSHSIIEKYCEWAGSTAFLFHYADTVCSRLTTLFDNGGPQVKALALVSMLRLGSSHNRWHVMRCALSRCSDPDMPRELAVRLRMEISIENGNSPLRRCVSELQWDNNRVHPEIRKLLK